jgi:hypothetical protein
MRKKTVEYDGQAYTISPLTMEQLDKFVTSIPLMSEEPSADEISNRAKALAQRARELVAWGLQNAQEKDAEPWTPERVYQEIDLDTFVNLQTAIMEFGGLRRKQLKEGENVVDFGGAPAN